MSRLPDDLDELARAAKFMALTKRMDQIRSLARQIQRPAGEPTKMEAILVPAGWVERFYEILQVDEKA